MTPAGFQYPKPQPVVSWVEGQVLRWKWIVCLVVAVRNEKNFWREKKFAREEMTYKIFFVFLKKHNNKWYINDTLFFKAKISKFTLALVSARLWASWAPRLPQQCHPCPTRPWRGAWHRWVRWQALPCSISTNRPKGTSNGIYPRIFEFNGKFIHARSWFQQVFNTQYPVV